MTDASQSVESGVSGHFFHLGTQIGQAIIDGESGDWMIAGGLDLYYFTHKYNAILTSGTALAEGSMRHFLFAMPVSTWWEQHFGFI